MLSTEFLAAKQAFSPETTAWPSFAVGRVTHAVHGLIECPELEKCTFVLVDRKAAPQVEVLLVGDLDQDAPSLNRARPRNIGANLGVRLSDIDVHVFAAKTSVKYRPTRPTTSFAHHRRLAAAA